VSTATRATRHAGGLYRKTFNAVSKPFRKVEQEVHHLENVERTGESGETPLIAFLGVILFVLPIFLLMLGLALLAAHLAG
jgi:hypothetical protein